MLQAAKRLKRLKRLRICGGDASPGGDQPATATRLFAERGGRAKRLGDRQYRCGTIIEAGTGWRT